MGRKTVGLNISRLYRQAEQGGKKLLSDLLVDQPPFHKGIKAIAGNDKIVISGIRDAEKKLESAQKRVHLMCRRISPHIAVSVLLQAMMHFYYGQIKRTPYWLGMTLKCGMELISGNLYSHSPGTSKSVKDILEVVRATAVLEQLRALFFVLEAFGNDNDFAIIHGASPEVSDHLKVFLKEFQKPPVRHERFMRTLPCLSVIL